MARAINPRAYEKYRKEKTMKTHLLTSIALITFSLAFAACENTEAANEKIKECLEDEYGEEEAETVFSQWELTCEDGEQECDECVECVLDEECEDLLDGSCDDTCH